MESAINFSFIALISHLLLNYPLDLAELRGYMDIEGNDYGFFEGIINIG